jgi:hypothetical protein
VNVAKILKDSIDSPPFSEGVHSLNNLKYRVERVKSLIDPSSRPNIYIYFRQQTLSLQGLINFAEREAFGSSSEENHFDKELKPYRKLFIHLLLKEHPELLV